MAAGDSDSSAATLTSPHRRSPGARVGCRSADGIEAPPQHRGSIQKLLEYARERNFLESYGG
jgi:hypothetical protein